MKKVEKSGVYRDGETGHAIYLAEGDQVEDRVLDTYSLDSDGTKANAEEPAPQPMSSIVDAPQDMVREEADDRQNKADAPTRSTKSGDKSDAANAADAAAGSSR